MVLTDKLCGTKTIQMKLIGTEPATFKNGALITNHPVYVDVACGML